MARARRHQQSSADGSLSCLLCGSSFSEDRAAGVYGCMADGEDVSDCAGNAVEIEICGMPVMGIVPNAGSPAHAQGYDVLFLVCSHDCVKAMHIAAGIDRLEDTGQMPDPALGCIVGLRRRRPANSMTIRALERMQAFEDALRYALPAVAARMGLDQPVPQYGPDATPEQRAAVEACFMRSCAWCAHAIAEDEPVQALTVWLNDADDAAARTPDGGVIALKVGERLVPATLPESGSPAFGTCDAVFMLCSTACGAALRAAIDEDKRLRIVH